MKAKHVKTNFHSEPRRESWENAESELKRLANFLGGFYQESDRGAVLMAASILDEVLASMIQMFLTDTSASKQLVEGLNAPLGTFNSRILAAYSLGLIEEQEYKEVEVIRKLRHLFGQSWEGMDFETPSVKEQIEKLPFEKATSRDQLNTTVANLLGDWMWRERWIKKEKRSPKKWSQKADFTRQG